MTITVRTTTLLPSVVNTHTSESQTMPSTAYLADGGYVVLWQSSSQEGEWGRNDIYSQRYDAAGQKVGGETRVNTLTNGNQGSVEVVGLADGGYVAVWHSMQTSDPADEGIYSQRFNAAGAPVGGEVHVAPAGGEIWNGAPDVTALADGGYVLAWTGGVGLSTSGIFLQRYDSVGTAVGARILSPASTVADLNIASGTDGGLMLAWNTSANFGGHFVRHFDASGAASAAQYHAPGAPTVAALSDGTYVVAGAGGGPQVILQRYDSSGAPLGESFTANTSIGSQYANVVALPGGGFVVSWSNTGLFAQFFDNAGHRVGDEILIDPEMGMYVSVVGLAGGGYVATWQRQQLVGTSYEVDIVQRHVSAASITPHLTSSVDFAQGNAQNDDFLVDPTDLNPGDQIDGGGGSDRLILQSGGTYDFRGVQMNGVSAITGTAGDDVLIFSDLPKDLTNISGGGLGGHDTLVFDGALDLGRLPVLSDGSWTVRSTAAAVTFAITRPFDSAIHLDGIASKISIDASTYALTASERAALFSDGVVQISQPGDVIFYSPTLAMTAGTPVRVNTYDIGYQSSVKASSLADGGFVAIWVSQNQDGMDGGVFGQRYDAAGAKVGAEFAVNTYTPGAQRNGVAAGLADGGFVVTWESQSQGIFQQRFDASGARVGSETIVNNGPIGEEPDIAALSGGGYVVVWSQITSNSFVFAQRFDNQGARVGEQIVVPTATAGQSFDASVAALTSGGFVVTWTAGGEISGQRFGADGSKLGGEFVVNADTAGFQLGSTVTALPDGGFIVGWLTGYTSYGGREVHTQRFDASGARVGAETRADTAASDESSVTIEVLSNGDYIVAWTAHGRNADSTGAYPTIYADVYSQRYNSSGVAIGGEVRLNPTITGHQSDPSVVALPGGQFATLWTYLGTGYPDGSHVEMSLTKALVLSALTPNTDSVSAADGRSLLLTTTTADLGASDSLVGSAGVDRLDLTGGKILDLTKPATFTGFEILVGSSEDDVFIVSQARLTGVTHIFGSGEHDTVRLAASGVTDLSSVSLNSIEVIEGSGGDDRVIVAVKDLEAIVTLAGGAGADTLQLAGPGVLDLSGWQFVAWEQVVGSSGDDTFRLDRNTISGVSVNGGDGQDTVSYDLADGGVNARVSDFTSVENLTGSRFADILRGDAGSNTIFGGFGDDWVAGGLGNDRLVGGEGVDTISYQDASNRVSVNLAFRRADGIGLGIDTVEEFENVVGSAYDDLIEGDIGGNRLDGGAGIDTVSYSRAPSGVTVSLNLTAVQETGGGGSDILLNFENLEGSGFQDRLTGDAGANRLAGLAGDDVLIGGDGDDRLDGGAGSDTADYSGAASRVTVNLSVTASQATLGAGRDTLVSIETLIGSAFDDVLIGAAGANTLFGGAGNDILDGGGGDDRLDGGSGNDTVAYLETTAGVTVSLALQGAAQATGGAGNDTLVSIENLTGSAFADSLTGDAGVNVLIGAAGNDTLNGGAGADRLYGGVGDDVYVVDSQADLVFEVAGEGSDTVVATADFYLYDNIENLTLWSGAGDIFGVGNGLANTITGNAGANLLLGGGGNDTLGGLGGDDRLYGEDGNDVLTGGAGADWLVGGAGDDTLDGATGGSGEQDLLFGGAGNDSYRVDAANDFTFEDAGGGTDTVTADFAGGTYYLYGNVENLTLAGTTLYGVGNELDNVLVGSASGNWLLGGAGNDTLNGKAGGDVLFGQGGADTFVFERGTGGDVIGDFAVGVDKVKLAGIYSSFAEVQSHMVQNGTDSAIVIGDGDLVVFQNVAMSAFTAGDFLF